MSKELAPLQNTLDSILSRLAQLESHAGLKPPVGSISKISNGVGPNSDESGMTTPAIEAYQKYMNNAVIPFIEACDALTGLDDTGSNIRTIWISIESIVELATKCKKPSDIQAALGSYLKPIQDAIGTIRSARLDRKYDWHIKAIMEMLPCASWVIMSAPPAPCNFVKDTIGSSDFWSNKIRREYKGKDEKHVAFCNTLKSLIIQLSAYVKEYHLSGLAWNLNGVSIEQYKSSGKTSTSNAVSQPVHGNVMHELASRRTREGNSAASGLRSVSREQQTWRKEYKGASTKSPVVASTVKPSQIKAKQIENEPKLRTPVCVFKPPFKWLVEYQTKSSNPNGVCVIDAKSPKEQIYIYKCENATIKVNGKIKTITMDSCIKTNLLFESAISSCEVVNCNKIQIQCTAVCPSYSIDKTDGCLIYLSKEAVPISKLVTTKSSEMNVSWEDEKSGEQVEVPVPEQFVHSLINGALTSEVSDLYH